ncbi:MAG: NUDIX domain-containing protein [Geitlerinemataceae cyanobacterium]
MAELVPVALAILHRDDRFLMQLRDDKPGILYPGVWGFFGGHMEPGETPEVAVVRELEEELGYTAPKLEMFDCHIDGGVKRHMFWGPLTVEPEALDQTEGWDLGLVTEEEARKGQAFSVAAGKVCKMGAPHQKILLGFIDFYRQQNIS